MFIRQVTVNIEGKAEGDQLPRGGLVEVVKAATDGEGVNVVLDMVGGDYIQRAMARLALAASKLIGPSFLMSSLSVETSVRKSDNTFACHGDSSRCCCMSAQSRSASSSLALINQ